MTLANPYAGSPSPGQADAWGRGFLGSFADPTLGVDPPEAVDPADADAYGQGVQDGRQTGIDGVATDRPCIPAAEPSPGETLEHMVTGVESLHAVWEIAKLGKLAAGIAGLVVVLIEVGSSAEHTLPPEQMLPDVATPLLDTLTDYGMSNLAVFCGAGLDPLAAECEIRLTNLYPTQSSAHDAVTAMGRPEWVVASWRTDQCGSFQIVDSS